MFFLAGVARYLFVPLAEAVVFAMLASYVLSRTLVPTLVLWFYRNVQHCGHDDARPVAAWLRPFSAIHRGFERGFARFRESYRRLPAAVLGRRGMFATVFIAFCAGSFALVPPLGQDFFSSVDAGQFRLHLRARRGTRIEETAKLVDEVEAAIRDEVPAEEFAGMMDNIGVPSSGIALSYSARATARRSAETPFRD